MDLVYRANETVVRRGNDANGGIDAGPVAGLSIRIQESRILNGALRMAQGKVGIGQLHQRPGPPARRTRIRITMPLTTGRSCGPSETDIQV